MLCRPNFWFVALTSNMSFAQMSLVLDATCLVFLNFRLNLPPSNRRTGPPSHRFDPFPQLFSRFTLFSSCFLLLFSLFSLSPFPNGSNEMRRLAWSFHVSLLSTWLPPTHFLHPSSIHAVATVRLRSIFSGAPSFGFLFVQSPRCFGYLVVWSFFVVHFFFSFSRCLCTNFQRILAGTTFFTEIPCQFK